MSTAAGYKPHGYRSVLRSELDESKKVVIHTKTMKGPKGGEWRLADQKSSLHTYTYTVPQEFIVKFDSDGSLT
jgi:hypothetical protein